MEPKNIEDILNRYWEGNTSLEEEKWLKAYFSNTDIDPKWKSYQAYFINLVKAKSASLNSDFDKRFWDAVQIQDSPLKNSSPKVSKIRTLYPRLAQIAAVFLLLAASIWVFDTHTPNPSKKGATVIVLDDADDAEEAYAKVTAALMLVSTKINHGRDEAIENLYKVKTLDKIKLN